MRSPRSATGPRSSQHDSEDAAGCTVCDRCDRDPG
jgi:hypothetical protein